MICNAYVTPCGRFRPWLMRQWADGPRLLWAMLNPSTAGAQLGDPTVSSCIRISAHHGFGGLEIVNMYDYRATMVRDLKSAGYPRSAEWEVFIHAALGTTSCTVAAWGANARPHDAAVTLHLLRSVRPVYRVALTKSGQPGHPLYVRHDAPLVLHE